MAGLIFNEKIFYRYLWSIYPIKNVWEVTIVNNGIECANRIVYQIVTYKAVVVSGGAGECFISL